METSTEEKEEGLVQSGEPSCEEVFEDAKVVEMIYVSSSGDTVLDLLVARLQMLKSMHLEEAKDWQVEISNQDIQRIEQVLLRTAPDSIPKVRRWFLERSKDGRKLLTNRFPRDIFLAAVVASEHRMVVSEARRMLGYYGGRVQKD